MTLGNTKQTAGGQQTRQQQRWVATNATKKHAVGQRENNKPSGKKHERNNAGGHKKQKTQRRGQKHET